MRTYEHHNGRHHLAPGQASQMARARSTRAACTSAISALTTRGSYGNAPRNVYGPLPQNVSMWPLSPMKQNPVAALTPRQIGNAEYC